MQTNTQVKAFKGHSKYLTSFVIDTKENTIYTSSFDHLIIAWDMKVCIDVYHILAYFDYKSQQNRFITNRNILIGTQVNKSIL